MSKHGWIKQLAGKGGAALHICVSVFVSVSLCVCVFVCLCVCVSVCQSMEHEACQSMGGSSSWLARRGQLSTSLCRAAGVAPAPGLQSTLQLFINTWNKIQIQIQTYTKVSALTSWLQVNRTTKCSTMYVASTSVLILFMPPTPAISLDSIM